MSIKFHFRSFFFHYCPQSCGKVIFLHLSVSHSVHKGGRAWQGGACMACGGVQGTGGMCGRGACMVGGGGVWQGGMHERGCMWQGGMWGTHTPHQILQDMVNEQGVCMARGHAWHEGVCVAGGHAWKGVHVAHTHPHQILPDMVNERAVSILLECILVNKIHSQSTF